MDIEWSSRRRGIVNYGMVGWNKFGIVYHEVEPKESHSLCPWCLLHGYFIIYNHRDFVLWFCFFPKEEIYRLLFWYLILCFFFSFSLFWMVSVFQCIVTWDFFFVLYDVFFLFLFSPLSTLIMSWCLVWYSFLWLVGYLKLFWIYDSFFLLLSAVSSICFMMWWWIGKMVLFLFFSFSFFCKGGLNCFLFPSKIQRLIQLDWLIVSFFLNTLNTIVSLLCLNGFYYF